MSIENKILLIGMSAILLFGAVLKLYYCGWNRGYDYHKKLSQHFEECEIQRQLEETIEI